MCFSFSWMDSELYIGHLFVGSNLIFYSFRVFFLHQLQLVVFHQSLSDSKSPQVSRTHLSILADLRNSVIWTVSNRFVISKSSSPCTNPLVDCTKSTNYSWYNGLFHVPQFFQFSSKVKVLIFLLAFFQLCSVVSRNIKVHHPANSLSCLFIVLRSGRLAEIR